MEHMPANEQLEVHELTVKVAMLMASVSTTQGIQVLDPTLMERTENTITFRIAKLTKSKRPSKPHVTLTFTKYTEKKNWM